MATIRDVAKLAGVSVASVSAVTNGRRGVSSELAERVRKAVDILDYHPDHVARSLRVRRTYIIGIIMPQIASPFFAEVLRGVEEEARRTDYSIVICDSTADPAVEQRLLKTLVAKRVDGILLASADPYFSSARNVLRKKDFCGFFRPPASGLSRASRHGQQRRRSFRSDSLPHQSWASPNWHHNRASGYLNRCRAV